MKRSASFLCLLALAAGISAHASTVVYDNSDSFSFNDSGILINGGISVANSFSLSSPATIDAISFGVWLEPEDTLDSVDWEITTDPNSGTVLESGTATVFSTVYEGLGLSIYPMYDDTFDIGSLSLADDTTYYLEFSNAVTADRTVAFWDLSDNPNSTAYVSETGVFYESSYGSQTFALEGSFDSPVPEPPGLLLLGSGLAGLALIGMMRRRAMAASQIGRCA